MRIALIREKMGGKAQRGCVDLVESFSTSYLDAEGRLSAPRTSVGGEFSTVVPVSDGEVGALIVEAAGSQKGCFPVE